MELMFNELSAFPPAEDQNRACSAVIQYIKTYKEAEKHDFKRIRYEKSFDQIEIAPHFTLNDFCYSPSPKLRTYGSLLLGLAKHPFIDNNSPEEKRFIDNDFFIEREGNQIPVEGLGVAFLYKSIGISFSFDPFWKQINHKLHVKGKEAGIYPVLAISHPDHCLTPEFTTQKDLWKPVDLIPVPDIPENKTVHLRDDHGKNELQAFAKKLCRSPYIKGIVNSLPFQPTERNFIHTIKENGLIEVVLPDTDQGLGLVIQTTGRNIRETKTIAEILEQEFFSGKRTSK